jgi:hypothetical protein
VIWGAEEAYATVRGGNSWPLSRALPSPKATFLNLIITSPYFAVSILERVVPLITEAVVEATAAGGGERRRFLAHKLISAIAQSHFS